MRVRRNVLRACTRSTGGTRTGNLLSNIDFPDVMIMTIWRWNSIKINRCQTKSENGLRKVTYMHSHQPGIVLSWS